MEHCLSAKLMQEESDNPVWNKKLPGQILNQSSVKAAKGLTEIESGHQ